MPHVAGIDKGILKDLNLVTNVTQNSSNWFPRLSSKRKNGVLLGKNKLYVCDVSPPCYCQSTVLGSQSHTDIASLPMPHGSQHIQMVVLDGKVFVIGGGFTGNINLLLIWSKIPSSQKLKICI